MNPSRWAMFIRVLLALCSVIPVSSESPAAYQVKAAYLLNFARFVTWPPLDSRAPFVIGVLGADPFGNTLDQIAAGKSIDNRPISIRRFSSARQVEECQVLFISSSELGRLESTIKHFASSPILTISDIPSFIQANGAIRLVEEGGRIQFDINLQAIQAAGLRADSRLMRLARTVTPKPALP